MVCNHHILILTPFFQETEPFDELLVRRRQASTEEQLVWDKTLADRRRKAPREVERVVQDLLLRQSMAIPHPAPVDPIAPPKAPGTCRALLFPVIRLMHGL